MSDNLLRNVRAALDESGLPAQQLELEITESAVMADMEKAIAAMQGLREIGTRLAIDDFGTGFSSLAYLKRFPVQALKIDRSFVQEILLSTEDAAIAAAVISLGKSLNLEVIAEGVEEAEQAEHLRQEPAVPSPRVIILAVRSPRMNFSPSQPPSFSRLVKKLKYLAL